MSRTRFPITMIVAGLALAGAACSDQTVAGPDARTPDARSLSLGTGIPAGTATLQQTIVSNAATTFVGYNSNATSNPAFGDAFTNPTGLTTHVVTTPNVAWGGALGTSSWIQVLATANGSNIVPGTYRFQTTFTVPAGATNLLLNLSTLGDNAVNVFLNGVGIGGQAVQDCLQPVPFANNAACNWSTPLNLTDNTNIKVGLNTLTIDVTNSRVGYNGKGPGDPTASAACATPTDAGTDDQGNAWNSTTCQNPSGLDFSASVYFTPAPPPPAIPLFVIGDVEPHGVGAVVNFWGAQWWKNNPTSITPDNGWQSFKGFAPIAGTCGQTWSSGPGNSDPPPAPPLSSDIAIIVTNTVTKSGNTLGGNIVQIVIVHQDGNYSDNPGHAGGGTVTSVVCTAP